MERSHSFLEVVSRESDDENGVGGGDTETHDCAHHRRDAQRRAGDVESPNDPCQGTGQRGENDERVKPALKVDDQEQIDQRNRHDQAEGQPQKAGSHSLSLAAQHDRTAMRQ